MAISSLTSAKTLSPRRHQKITCNRRTDYLGRIAAAEGDPRLQVGHAADAVRAASKNLVGDSAGQVVQALLGLAGLSDDPAVNEAAARLLELAGRPARA
jgi:hypothetical protein